MSNLKNNFGLPQSLIDAVINVINKDIAAPTKILTELSPTTLKSYSDKALVDAQKHLEKADGALSPSAKKYSKRLRGMGAAKEKLSTESLIHEGFVKHIDKITTHPYEDAYGVTIHLDNGKTMTEKHGSRKEAHDRAKEYHEATSKSATLVHEEKTDSVVRDSKGKLLSWKHDSGWNKKTNRTPRGVVTHDSDKAIKQTQKMLATLAKESVENTNINEHAHDEVRSRVSSYKKLGFNVSNDQYSNKDGKPYAEFTVTDKEGVARRHIFHGDSRKVENLGQKSPPDDVEKKRGPPIKDKFGVKEEFLDEKSTSEKQARFMAAAAHNPEFAKKAGISQSVAKEFNKADTGTK